jgi:hypothetical protein
MKSSKGFLLSCLLAAALPAAAAERTLELRLDGTRPVEVHNLLGAVRIVPGSDALVIRASVSAGRDEHADQVRLETRQRGGVDEVVVAYPEGLSRIRYQGEEFRRIDATVDYQGRRVRVTGSRGDPLRVDLDIEVPPGATLAMRQRIGQVSAAQVDAKLRIFTRYGRAHVTDGAGSLRADTGSGSVTVAGFRGEVVADTGSGSVRIENVLGGVKADTGSGAVALRGIDGDILVDTGSGGVRLNDVAGSLDIDTGSGAVRAEGVMAGSRVSIDTGSGSVSLAGDFGSVRDLLVDTGSGSVSLESSAPLSLRLDLRTGSGGIRVDVPGLRDVSTGRRSFRGVAGAGEGSGRVSTGSGSIRISAP